MKRTYSVIAVAFFVIVCAVGIFLLLLKNQRHAPSPIMTSQENAATSSNPQTQISVPALSVLSGVLVSMQGTELSVQPFPASSEILTVTFTPETLHKISVDDQRTQSIKLSSAPPSFRAKKGTKISIIGEGVIGTKTFKPVQITYSMNDASAPLPNTKP